MNISRKIFLVATLFCLVGVAAHGPTVLAQANGEAVQFGVLKTASLAAANVILPGVNALQKNLVARLDSRYRSAADPILTNMAAYYAQYKTSVQAVQTIDELRSLNQASKTYFNTQFNALLAGTGTIFRDDMRQLVVVARNFEKNSTRAIGYLKAAGANTTQVEADLARLDQQVNSAESNMEQGTALLINTGTPADRARGLQLVSLAISEGREASNLMGVIRQELILLVKQR